MLKEKDFLKKMRSNSKRVVCNSIIASALFMVLASAGVTYDKWQFWVGLLLYAVVIIIH